MQTSYALETDKAFEGMLADNGLHDVLSFKADGAIPFGRLVVRSTAVDQGKLPAASTDVTVATNVLGVAISKASVELVDGVAQYADETTVNVMRKGRVWVKADEAVTTASAVFVRYAAGGSIGLGAFGDTAGTSERAALAGARYLTAGAAGDLVLMEVDFTAK